MSFNQNSGVAISSQANAMSNISGISRHSGISGLSNVNVNLNDSQSLRKNAYPDLVPISTNSANAPQGIPQLK